MPLNLTEEQILQLAPDDSSVKAGKGLATLSKWVLKECSGRAVWGHCQGSGKNPYQTVIDLNDIAFKCSCPSRKTISSLRSCARSSASSAAPPSSYYCYCISCACCISRQRRGTTSGAACASAFSGSSLYSPSRISACAWRFCPSWASHCRSSPPAAAVPCVCTSASA